MAAESRLESAGLTTADDVVAVDLDEGASSAVRPDAGAQMRARLRAAERLLREEPHSFGFFQAVRLLERLFPAKARVGGFDDPAREVVRFGVPPSLAFPASEIQQLEISDEAPSRMRVNFFGLTGPQGVLPHAYTLLADERLRSRDGAFADFLDIFHHRLLSLFYQAWRKYQFTIAREDGARDALRERLLDLIGLGFPASRDRLPVPDDALLYYAGLLAPQPRGAAALDQLLEGYFQVPVEIVQFVGGWYAIAPADRCAIDDEPNAGHRLGGAVLGDEIWDAQARVRVRLGPLSREQYRAFLPGGTAHNELAGLLRFFSHDRFEFQLQLVLAADQVPGLRLDGAEAESQLGWSTWIRSAPRDRDADETLLTLDPGAAS